MSLSIFNGPFMLTPSCFTGSMCLANGCGLRRAAPSVLVYAFALLLRRVGSVATAKNIFEFGCGGERRVHASYGKGTFEL